MNLVSARPSAAATAGERHHRLIVVCFACKVCIANFLAQTAKQRWSRGARWSVWADAALPPSAAAAAAAAATGEGLPRTGERCLDRLHPPLHS